MKAEAGVAPTLTDIHAAAEAIAGAVLKTPFLPAPRLSRFIGAEVWVKYENLQATASFKERGALVKLLSLGADERRRGVVAMSAGNHAQAVAYHAQRLGIAATIVMPKPTPFVKIAATRAFGAEVVLEGETLAEAEERAMAIVAERGATLVHPYDDPAVIAGQGTVGLEVVAAKSDLDAVVVPVGGGGLISGVAIAIKGLAPRCAVIGVESELYQSVRASLGDAGPPTGGETLAEGIAVKNVGHITIEVIRQLVDEVVAVGEDGIEQAVAAYLMLQKTMAEGAGAAPLAALIADRARFHGRKVGLILAGGNIDPRLAASIMVRELAREEQVIAVRIVTSDRPGMLADIARAIAERGGNVLEVFHHRAMLAVPAKAACIDFTIETHGSEHAADIVATLVGHGFRVDRIESPDPGNG
jgi:threonine dehydratase